MSMTSGEKFKRSYLMHFLDNTFGGDTPSYVGYGRDMEEFNISADAETNEITNIYDKTEYDVTKLTKSSSIETLYVRKGSTLGTALAEKLISQASGEALKTTAIDALFEYDGTTWTQSWAYKQSVVVTPKSLGGKGGVIVAFDVKYTGSPTSGYCTPTIGDDDITATWSTTAPSTPLND